MNDRRRPTRRGRGPRPQNRAPLEAPTEPSPYRDDAPASPGGEVTTPTGGAGGESPANDAATPMPSGQQGARDGRFNGRRGRRGRGRNGPRPEQQNAPAVTVTADGTTEGWFDAARDGGFVRRATDSY